MEQITVQTQTEQQAFRFCEETRLLKDKIELGWLELSKRLCLIKLNNLAESQYGGFDLYLDEIKLKRSSADHMMRGYERFCINFGIEEALVVKAGGWTRLYEIMPLAKDKKTALEWLERIALLPSRESIKTAVKEALNANVEACRHQETYKVEICKCCSAKWKVIDSEK